MHKKNYPVLDGLRGIAAISVGVLHASNEVLHHDLHAMAFLAVDFFFCLSGFVLAHAYAGDLAQGRLGWLQFQAMRLRRLYPMIFAGALLGMALALLSGRSAPREALMTGAATLVLAPAGFAFGHDAYPVNNALWSLLFELVAGALFVPLAPRSNRAWAGLVLASAVMLGTSVLIGADYSAFGFRNPVLFLLGVPRVLLPFALGVLVQRAVATRAIRLSPVWSVGLLLVMLYVLPGPMPRGSLVCTLLVVPAIVVLGALARDVQGAEAAALRALGTLSYPFYAVHLPVMLLAGTLADAAGAGTPARAMAAIAAFILATALALLLERWWDRPVRSWLAGSLIRPRLYPSAR